MSRSLTESKTWTTETYFGGDELASDVFYSKYALRDTNGNLLEFSPDDMHKRLAKEFARIEAKYPNPLSEEEIYNYLKNFKYIVPQGSPMSGIGNHNQIMSISNCFVIPAPWDSYSGILLTDQQQVQIMKRRGGVGFDISTLRPRGMATSNAALTTDGIRVFMQRYSNSCEEVAQGGRRGALMLTIDVRHPDIYDFVHIKNEKGMVEKANISIRLTDEFMKSVNNKGKFKLQWPVDSDTPEVTREIDAEHLWNEIIQSAWASAEPGLLFWDTCTKNTPADAYNDFKSVSTNPCGEVLLSPYDSCRLLVINTHSFVKNPFSPFAEFDFSKFQRIVQVAQRLMDDLIDLELECIDGIIKKINQDPEPDAVKAVELNLWQNIRNACVRGRRTGLGVTSIGDSIAKMRMTYGDEASIELVENIYKTLAIAAWTSSAILAKERGAFPEYDAEKELNHPFIQKILASDDFLRDMHTKYGRRNIALTTTAPAGSVSIMTQTTSGIEPVFRTSYTRKRRINSNDTNGKNVIVDNDGVTHELYKVYHHGVTKWMDMTEKTDEQESPYWNSTSDKIDWVNRVKLQAAAQRWICHSISSTVNIPKESTVEDVKNIYMEGWKSGCKGVTVYRDGCRDGVLISNDAKPVEAKFAPHSAPKRPKELPCDIHQATIQGEKWTIFVGKLEGQAYEIFGGLSKFVNIPKKVKEGRVIKYNGAAHPIARYDLHYGDPDDETVIKDLTTVFENPIHGSFTRTISLALRHGAPVQYVVEQLQKGDKDSSLYSFNKVIARVLKTYIVNGTKVSSEKACPTCKEDSLAYQDGCVSCTSCGWSKCS